MNEHRGLTRRQFLAGAAGAVSAGVGVGGVALSRRSGGGAAAPAAPPVRAAAPAPVEPAKGILVLVGLYGGNDGLNTLIPMDAGPYFDGRGDLAYRAEEVLSLGNGQGLHPNLRRLKGLWDEGRLAIVRGVGYANPNRSHFRSMDIWQTAVPHDVERTGWLGRWLDRASPDAMQALAVNPNLPRALVGAKQAGISVPLGRFDLPPAPGIQSALRALAEAWPGEAELAAQAAQSWGRVLQVDAALKEVRERAPGPVAGLDPVNRNNTLAVQLEVVSQSIRTGVPTRVYAASLSGFDTHQQEKGNHANLMAQVDEAIGWFLASLRDDPRASQVVVMTFSEFGRRVSANGSGGTDHGAAAPLFVVGPSVKGGFYGEEPSLTELDDGDLRYTTDFRSVYATVLDHVLGMDPADVLGARFADLGFL